MCNITRSLPFSPFPCVLHAPPISATPVESSDIRRSGQRPQSWALLPTYLTVTTSDAFTCSVLCGSCCVQNPHVVNPPVTHDVPKSADGNHDTKASAYLILLDFNILMSIILLTNINRFVKSRGMSLAGYEVCMGKIKNANNSTGWQNWRDKTILRPKRTWEDNIKLKRS